MPAAVDYRVCDAVGGHHRVVADHVNIADGEATFRRDGELVAYFYRPAAVGVAGPVAPVPAAVVAGAGDNHKLKVV